MLSGPLVVFHRLGGPSGGGPGGPGRSGMHPGAAHHGHSTHHFAHRHNAFHDWMRFRTINHLIHAGLYLATRRHYSTSVVVTGTTYYYASGYYMVKSGTQYVVVDPPPGAVVYAVPTSTTVVYAGDKMCPRNQVRTPMEQYAVGLLRNVEAGVSIGVRGTRPHIQAASHAIEATLLEPVPIHRALRHRAAVRRIA